MDMFESCPLGQLLGESDDCVITNTGSDVLPMKLAYGMAYVPFQKWGRVYESDVALSRGTAFPCLDKPFIGEEVVCDDKD
ncbi:MAG: spore coat associated protein CotJA [Ruminococcus sp.]|nr:spore coat associated protein CotJA [Ruminococcus sp.]